MMLQEALKLIQRTAVDAASAEILSLPGDGRKAYVRIGAELREIDILPRNRQHIVHTLDDIINYVADKENAVVWHGDESVTVILDDNDRRDTVTLPLTKSARFETLAELVETQPSYDQKAFIRLLRFELGLDNLKVVAPFRRLQWENGARIDSQINRGDAKIGKSIVERIEGIDQLPEELAVPTPVYSESGEREEYIVRCGVEIDAANQRFQLLPLPDELARVVDLAQASIRERLVGSLKCPIYYGSP